MPYNPTPVSEGGNRGIDETFTRAPEEGNFRVIGVDTFDGGDFVFGDFETLEEAVKLAKEKSGNMLKTHIYDKSGKHVSDFGKF